MKTQAKLVFKQIFQRIFSSYIFWGVVIIIIYMLPNIILGKDSYLFFFDTWDSEIFFYKLNAKYFTQINGTIPEVMNGLEVGSVNVFSPIQTLVYMVLDEYWAFVFNDFWVRVIGFLGIYLLLDKILDGQNKFISFFSGIVLAYLPVFSIYGTSMFGQAMLAYALWNLIENKRKISSYAYIVFFGISSSLILTGFYILAIILLLAIVLNIKKGLKQALPVYLSFLIITALYFLTHFKMIYNLVFQNFVSMRIERVTGSRTFVDFLVLFFGGHMHAISVQVYAFLALMPVVVIFFIKLKTKTLNPTDKKYLNIIWLLLGYNLLAALINSFYYSKAGIWLSSRLGFLEGFQYRRVFFSYPVTWNLIFGLSLFLLYQWGVFDFVKNLKTKLTKPVLRAISLCLAFLFAFGVTTIYESVSKEFRYVYLQNVQRLFYRQAIKDGYISYNQLVDQELFDLIKKHINQSEQDYRVVSVGIYPVVASMNGFYTLDGYFQLYSLRYKHEFRQIIAGELEKSPELKAYFDQWGNKCYVFSAELGRYYEYSKNANISINLDINTAKLKEMGGEYIFSAVEIKNYQQLNLSFEGVFTTPQSYFKVYLYQAN